MSAPKPALSLLQKKAGATYSSKCENQLECLETLQLILDNEASSEQLAYFQAHLDECLPCLESYNLEVTIRQVLHDKIRKVPVPTDLIETIKGKIGAAV